MGGNSSKEEDSWRPSYSSPSSRPTSFSRNQYDYPPPQPSYSQPSYPTQDYQDHTIPTAYPAFPSYAPPSASSSGHHPPQDHYSTPAPNTGSYNQHRPQKRLDKRYSRIADNYNSLEEVTDALRRAGLESSNLIVGIDFTKSNEWTGKYSFNRKSLHHIGDGFNPYEQAISIIGKTLAAFDDDNLIPCYGFGDASTHDRDVFSFYPDDRSCNGFEEVLRRYRELVPHVKMAGPTSFAPVIEMAMKIVEQSGGQYHVLIIIADGQVTRSVNTESGQLSPQEQKTVDAIVEASKLPLSIVLVGVGDGPWDMMKEFDDNIPARDFDNFQFVNFTEIMSKNAPLIRRETQFALSALMEIPIQYKATIELNMLGSCKGITHQRAALPPPDYGASSFSSSKPSYPTSFKESSPSYYGHQNPVDAAPYYGQGPTYYDTRSTIGTAPPIPSSTFDENQLCPICLSEPKNMAFGCGHQTCRECGQTVQTCPICREPIHTRIKLY